MTQARRHLLPPSTPLTVHCVQRCVRRAFLCGEDRYTGQSYEHRKDWVQRRLHHVASCFAVGIHAYAIMSNHLHVVLQLDPGVAVQWSDSEVAERWVRLFPPRQGDDEARDAKQSALLSNVKRLKLCRSRLSNLSWFMRCLAEPLARQANAEDGCKGRFWEGRFKCQRLLDDRALLAAMVYVDLNPIRAGITDRIDARTHTSLHERLQSLAADSVEPSAPTATVSGIALVACLPLGTYLNLVDWTGRQLSPGKRGVIRGKTPPCLARMGANPIRWANEVKGVGSNYCRAVGTAQALMDLAVTLGQQWMKGIGFARMLNQK